MLFIAYLWSYFRYPIWRAIPEILSRSSLSWWERFPVARDGPATCWLYPASRLALLCLSRHCICHSTHLILLLWSTASLILARILCRISLHQTLLALVTWSGCSYWVYLLDLQCELHQRWSNVFETLGSFSNNPAIVLYHFFEIFLVFWQHIVLEQHLL